MRHCGFPLLVASVLILNVGCAPKTGGDAATLGTELEPSTSIRFAIEVGVDVVGPIYVLLNEADTQLGWIKAFQDGKRIYFRERCELADCGLPPAVCGAAFPFIKKITPGPDGKSIEEFVWDGKTSIVDPESGCETRQPAPPGDYVARFCFSREAEFDENSDPSNAVPGRLISPTCTDKPFTLLEQDVVLTIDR